MDSGVRNHCADDMLGNGHAAQTEYTNNPGTCRDCSLVRNDDPEWSRMECQCFLRRRRMIPPSPNMLRPAAPGTTALDSAASKVIPFVP